MPTPARWSSANASLTPGRWHRCASSATASPTAGLKVAWGQALPDPQSGSRVYPRRETWALGTRAGHFAYETEVLIRAARAGMRIQSVPVRTYYPPVTERISHFRPVWDTVR